MLSASHLKYGLTKQGTGWQPGDPAYWVAPEDDASPVACVVMSRPYNARCMSGTLIDVRLTSGRVVPVDIEELF